MTEIEFENKYKQLIESDSLEVIIDLFEEKKKSYKNSKVTLLFQKIKDKFSKEKTAKFLELGYGIIESFDFTRTIFRLALDNHRGDVVQYLMKHDYLKSFMDAFYTRQTVNSYQVLETILGDKDITDTMTPYELGEMLKQCSMHNLVEQCDMICEALPEKVKQINKEDQDIILFYSAKFNSQQMLEKLLHMKEPLQFDINTMHDDPYNVIHIRENLLIFAAERNNIPMMKYLLTSPELDKHANLIDSFWWIDKLPKGKDLIKHIILDIKCPFTEELETLLNRNPYFLPYLELFKKRDLVMEMEEKFPAKNTKIKVKKI